MEIILSAHSELPIYEQVYNQIRSQVMDHSLKAGEELPSIRNLAKSLKVSVITIKKAYEMLIQDGFAISIKGKGTYVAEVNQEFVREEVIKELTRELQLLSNTAKMADIDLETLVKIIEETFNKDC